MNSIGLALDVWTFNLLNVIYGNKICWMELIVDAMHIKTNSMKLLFLKSMLYVLHGLRAKIERPKQ